MSGLEIAIDDTTGTGARPATRAIDFGRPEGQRPKPAGQWNQKAITARGPRRLPSRLNDEAVSSIGLDPNGPGQGIRPGGSKHKFTKVAIEDLNRPGYLGFQDHGKDAWFKNVRLKDLD